MIYWVLSGGYQYDKEGLLKEIINPLGISNTKNTFDEMGRTIKQIFPDGGVIKYKYEDENERVILTEQNANRIKYYHNEKFLNARIVYADGYELFEYNDQNQRTGYRDKNGNWYKYEYNDLGKLILERNLLGYEYKIQYNKAGKSIKEIAYDNSMFLI